MRQLKVLLALSAITLLCVALAAGQDAISAKAGMVNYFEGKVLLNGQELAYDRATFHQIPEGGVLEATAEGRAEVLLAPGVLLWLGEGSKIELVSDKLMDAKVRLLAGGVVVSSTEIPDEMAVSVLVNSDAVALKKTGIYRFEAAPASVYVYDGEAVLARAGDEIKVKKGRTLALAQPEADVAKFDKDETSALLLWAQSRDSYIQAASLASARSLSTGGYPTLSLSAMNNGFGYWVYNPYFGMYSFVPMGSALMSPWGYYYWSPRTVMQAYAPYYYGGGYYGGNNRGRVGRSVGNTGYSRGGFGNSSDGFGSYSRGASSSRGFGGIGGGRSMGSSEGGYTRGSSSMGGAMGGGGGSVSSGGASMGRGGASAGGGGRGGGGGGRGN